LVLVAGPAAAMQPARLTVVVDNVRSEAGVVHVAIWNQPDGFPRNDSKIVDTKIQPANGQSLVVFENLPPGRYAIAAFHDENGNGKFDRDLVGLPAEGLGFSNGAWIKLSGPPSFDEAAIDLDGDGQAETVIRLRY